jgi:hypothetical protein
MAKRGRSLSDKGLLADRAELAESRKQTAQQIRDRNYSARDQQVWLAATIVHTFESPKASEKSRARAKAAAELLRPATGLSPVASAQHVAQRYLEDFAADWNWHKGRDEGDYAAQNERIAKENAGLERRLKAIRNRFVTPDVPDRGTLIRLRSVIVNDPTTWPTLRLLKMATAMPERTISKIISSLRPKKGEIATLPLHHVFSNRRAFPKRHGPRLVLGVVEAFINCLKNYPLESSQGAEYRAIAMAVKRALTSKLSRFASMT